ncbi:MAG: ATP-grasp domain-containing protein, partial [Paludibacteraceae bacterium]|nr:ATP-grasp domain-containing protein [Paludibacteraceae bacterium]
VWHDSEFISQIGTFVFCDGGYSFYDEMTEEDLKELLEATANKGGIAFRGYDWVINGERTDLWFKEKNKKYHFRALSDYGGRLCVIESREKTQCERFKDLLVELGVRNAITLDAGQGWQNSWMRESDGRCRILHFFPWPFSSNRIVFKLRKPCKSEVETIAIIGTDVYNRQLFEKAREAGYRTIAFPYGRDRKCRELADKFYPVQATRTKKVISICRKENVIGVVANVLDETAEIVSRISSELGLHGIPYENFIKIRDKYSVRQLTDGIEGLSQIWYYEYDGTKMPLSYPCVVKPCTSTGKIGMSIAFSEEEYTSAVSFARKAKKRKIVVEEYIPGKEFCVEVLSFESRHQVIQITDNEKENISGKHCVDCSLHEPSSLPDEAVARIHKVVPEILRRVGYNDSAAHIEMKLTPEGKLYLIEINPRGGGDNISNFLVEYSTGYDYVRAMIDVAVGKFTFPTIVSHYYAGIYFLCKQTEDWQTFFDNADGKPWFVRKVIWSRNLKESTTNFNRQGFLMYKSDHKVLPNE